MVPRSTRLFTSGAVPHIDFDAGLWLWLLVVPVAYALYDWIATGRALRSHPPYRSEERPATVGEPATAGR